MGYTHYWYTDPDAPADAYGRTALDAKRLFAEAARQGYDLAGPLGEGDPELTEGCIAFNGRAPEGDYETFALEARPELAEWMDGPFVFACCKIGFMDPAKFRPYGDVVEALLIRAKVHYGDHLRVSSDGEWDAGPDAWGDWSGGRELYEATFDEPAPCPFDPAEVA